MQNSFELHTPSRGQSEVLTDTRNVVAPPAADPPVPWEKKLRLVKVQRVILLIFALYIFSQYFLIS